MNCKPGILAYIVRDDHNPCDIGKVVEVVSMVPPCEWIDADDPEWVCVSREPLRGFDENGEPTADRESDIPDTWLRPITGTSIDIDEDVSEDLRVKEPA